MKKLIIPLLTSLAFTSSAIAGENYSPKAAPMIAPAPCLWTWFAGGSGGYIDDWDEDMWTLHLGKEYKCPDSSCSHSIFLEVAFTDKDWSGDYYYDDYHPETTAQSRRRNERFEYSMDVIPITLNYKFECTLWNNLNWYIGGGAGIAITDIDVQGGNTKADDSETAFYGQLFTGLVYNFSESFEIFGGARWIYMDSGFDDINGHRVPGVLDDDLFYELGARFNF